MADADRSFDMGAVSAEYFALQSLRASTIGESSSRALLFFTTITGTLVALGLLSSSLTSSELEWAAVSASPVIGFIGLTSFLRITETAIEDVAAVSAMNRLRRWMVQAAPGLKALIIVPSGGPDTPGNEFISTGAHEHPLRILFTLGSTVGTVNGAHLAAAAAIVGTKAGIESPLSGIAGFAVGALIVGAHTLYQLRRYRQAVAAFTPSGEHFADS